MAASADELAGLIRDDIARALGVEDPIRRSALLRAAGRAVFEVAYEEAGGDPRSAGVEAAEFTNTLSGAMNQTIPDGTDEQVERITAIWSQAAANGAIVAASPADAPLSRTWITMQDDRVRELHQPMHGVTVAAGERFNVGGFLLRYPGEPVGPPEVWINCRCTLALGQGALAASVHDDGEAGAAEVTRPRDPVAPALSEEVVMGSQDDSLVARTYSAEQRRKMADRGTAMPDGSFPIADVEDLRNAIQAIGRAKDPDKAKAHIRKRARALGAENLIPDSWTASAEADEPLAADGELVAVNTHDAPGWVTHPRETQRLRDYWTKGAGAAKIRWGTPGDLTRCERFISKYVPPPFTWGTCQNMHHAAMGFFNPESRGRRGGGDPDEVIDLIDAAFLAAAQLEDDMMLAPPLEWFQDPGFEEPTPLTITSDGRVLGHLAAWETCHVGITGECTTPPHSQTNYAHFRTGEIETREGELVAVGQITMDTGHADREAGPQAAAAHYDNTGAGVADVTVGEDEHGIWVAGAMRPGVSEQQMYVLKATGALSGDWRRIGGNLELVAALAVNVPGFPIPRVDMAASAGRPLSLVAAAVVASDPNALDADRVAVAVLARLDQREADRARRARAEALTADIAALRVEALVAAVR